MRRWHRVATGVFLAVLALSPFTAAKEAPAPSVSGAVVDADGKPVKKAEVYLYYTDGFQGEQSRLIAKAKTNRKGECAFTDPLKWEGIPVPADYGSDGVSTVEYGVLVKHPKKGFGFTLFRKEHPTTAQRIVLRDLKTYRFDVKDAAGKPVAGVKAFVKSIDTPKKDMEGKAPNQGTIDGIGQDLDLFPCVTGADGKLTVDAPFGARFRLVKEGYVTQESKGGSVILSRPCTVSGKVTTHDNSPVANCWLRASFYQDKQYWDAFTKTDTAGCYSLQAPAEAKGQTEAEVSLSILPGKDAAFPKKELKIKTKGAGSSSQHDIVLDKTFRLAGTVTDLVTGKPVAGAALYCFYKREDDDSNGFEDITTDAEGRFCIYLPGNAHANLQWQTHSRNGDLLIDMPWLNQGGWTAFSGTVTEDTELNLRLRLVPVRQAKANVIGPDGKPLSNASVYIHSNLSDAKTNEAGVAELKAVPLGEDMVILATANGNTLMGVAPLPANAAEATVQLQPTASRRWRVLTPDGLPASRLQFYFQPMAGEQDINSLQERYMSDKDGYFSADHVCSATRYKVFWSGWDGDKENRDYEWGDAIIDLPALKAEDIPTFPAPRYNCALMGRVTDKDGKPVANARVNVQGQVVLNNEERESMTDANGEFTFSRLAQGQAELIASADGYKPAYVAVRSDSIDAALVLQPDTEPIHNRVRVLGPDGQPVPNAKIFVADTSYKDGKEDISNKRLTANSAGALDIVMPVSKERIERRICCDMPGYALAFAEGQTLYDSETTLQLAKEGEPYKGRVTDEQNKPIAGAKVTLKSQVEKRAPNSYQWKAVPNEYRLTTNTDAEGAFVLPRLNAAQLYMVEVSAEGFCDCTSRYDANLLKDGICMKRAGAITGKVVERGTGKPVAGMLVTLERQYQAPNVRAVSGPDGGFALEKVPAGRHALRAQDNKTQSKLLVYGSPTANVEAGATATITIEMEEGIEVTGKAVVKDPKVPGYRPPMAYVLKDGGTIATAPIAEDGTWKVSLPEGNFELLVPNSRNEYKTQPLRVKRGEPVKEIVSEVD